MESEEQYWNNTAWEGSDKQEYFYNTNNQVDTLISSTWNGISWDYSNKVAVVWTGNRATEAKTSNFNGSSWDPEARITMTYNANEYPLSEIFESWNGTAYVYDGSNSDYKQRYYYESYNNAVSVNDFITTFGQVNVYPNPVHDELVILLSKAVTESMQVSIMDMTGRIVAKQSLKKNMKELIVATTQLATGNYIININAQNGTTFSSKISKR